MDKNNIVWVWSSHDGLQTLIDGSLLKVVCESSYSYVGSYLQFKTDLEGTYWGYFKDKLIMHDQLQDFDRRIVIDKACKDIQNQEYLWNESVLFTRNKKR